MNLKNNFLLVVMLEVLVAPVYSLELNEFLKLAAEKNKNIKAQFELKEAAELRKKSGDVQLSPVISLKGSYLTDKKLPNFIGSSESKVTQYSASYGQKLSTGTQIALTATAIENANLGIQNPALVSTYGQYSTGMLGLSLSQSLWKDAFGRATDLRRERESHQVELERLAADVQVRQQIIDVENLYWEALYFQEELKQRKDSIERAKKIVQWVTRRVSDGIGDKADLLNAQSLLASRELQLISTEDEVRANQEKIRTLLNIPLNEEVPQITGKLENLKKQLPLSEKAIRLDVLLSARESQLKSVVANEIKEANRADLVLSFNYNTNSYESGGTYSSAMGSWSNTNNPTQMISLAWTYMFDTDAKDALLEVANIESKAAKLKSEQKTTEGVVASRELKRRYDEVSKRIDILKRLTQLQDERARVEQDKLMKGRSITSQVITSEQEAADSKLNLIKLIAEQHKLEAQAKMFVIEGEDL